MDINRALRSAAQTGKVLLGTRETIRAVKDKKAKLVVLADNTPKVDQDALMGAAKSSGVPVYKFQGTNQELGPACGKPFAVTMLGVLEAGESDVLALAREK
ncbi:MAG: 50S ribosomal protein L30e [Thermoplasmatota archaeon]